MTPVTVPSRGGAKVHALVIDGIFNEDLADARGVRRWSSFGWRLGCYSDAEQGQQRGTAIVEWIAPDRAQVRRPQPPHRRRLLLLQPLLGI